MYNVHPALSSTDLSTTECIHLVHSQAMPIWMDVAGKEKYLTHESTHKTRMSGYKGIEKSKGP